VTAVDEVRKGAPQPLTSGALARIRAAGVVVPQAPLGQALWAPQTAAEQHLMREGHRLDRVRQLLLDEIDRLRHGDSAEDLRRLTRGELAALAGAAAGESPHETAHRLHLSYNTVKGQRASAQRRLRARSIPHAVALAVAAGWITGEQIAGGVSP
jgi:DNA-binding CsgD family transcriptional regulator